MYSEVAIQSIINSIGFGDDFDTVTIDPENKFGTSGRLFSYFSKLVTLENLYDTVSEINMSSEDFNDYLVQLKIDAAKGAMVRLFDLNEQYLINYDYSDLFVTRPEVFQDVYGYTLAITAIEQMVTSKRINDSERNANLAYNKLKIELEGMTDDNGRIVARGLNRKLYSAMQLATDIIFPPKGLIIEPINFW